MKRLKKSPPPFAGADDFVPLSADVNQDDEVPYGYGTETVRSEQANGSASFTPDSFHGGHRGFSHNRSARDNHRNVNDRPKSRHALPGHEPWILVKTKLGRHFVHNTKTKESLWRTPVEVQGAVREFFQWERQQQEKDENARWAEQELQKMRESSRAEKVNEAADQEGKSRRRRSESLQREDEAALMAELAAEAEKAEEKDVKEAVTAVGHLRPVAQQVEHGYGSDSSYEEVEVTDSEFEEDGEEGRNEARSRPKGENAQPAEEREDEPVEFGEDDIAYQLAAMGEDYGLDPGEYGEEADGEEWDEGAEGLPLSNEDAANLFRDMLDDHNVNPFTPWEKLILDDSERSILMDDRYTILSSTKARKEVWESWVKDTAARRKDERAKMEKQDPRIPYLDFLADKATPKLYWPEFRRKYKKESAMNDRKLNEKEREKLYRDHINRLKLPESTRKADLIALLQSIPLRSLHKDTTLDTLPVEFLSHLHSISLPRATSEATLLRHISTLGPAPEEEEGELTEEQRAVEDKKRAERHKREVAMEARERKVEEEKRRAEKESRWAQRSLREEERELDRAMAGPSGRGLQAQLRD